MIDQATLDLLNEIVDRIVQHKYPERIQKFLDHLEHQRRQEWERGYAAGVTTR